MIINHNLPGMTAINKMNFNSAAATKSMTKLSSGLRINSAADDAAGLAISEKMKSQIRGLDQATANAQDGISMVQTGEGALSETTSILQRMRELAVQSSNDTNNSDDRSAIQTEMNQLTSEINRIGNTTEFNTKKLLNGDMGTVVAGSTTITTTTAVSKDYVPNYAEGLTWTGQTGDKPVISDGTNDNQIAFSDTGIVGGTDFTWSTMDASKTNTITITKSASTITVDIAAEDDDGSKLVINNDEMAYDDINGKYTYDANGVTFEMDKAEFDKMTDGASVAINLSAYDIDGTPDTFDITGATVGTVSDYTQTLTSGGTTNGVFGGTGVTVDTTDAAWIDGVTGIKITGTGLDKADGTGELKVELVDASGVTLSSETYTNAAASGDISYDNHGVTFAYTVNDTADLSLDMKFDTTTTTSSSTTSSDNSAKFQIGANNGQSMSLSISDMRSLALNISSGTASATKTVTDSMGNAKTASYTSTKNVTDGTNSDEAEYALDINTADKASAAISVLDDAIKSVSAERSKLGAVQNRLEHTINNLGTSSENLTSAQSRITDVDMAKEMSTFSKNNILAQAAQAMLAQANSQPQQVLQLLR